MTNNQSKSVTLSFPVDVVEVFPAWGEPNTLERVYCIGFISLLCAGFPARKIHAMKAVIMESAPRPAPDLVSMPTSTYAALALDLLSKQFGK